MRTVSFVLACASLLLTGCGPLAILGVAAGGAFDGGSSGSGGPASGPPSNGGGTTPPPQSGGGGGGGGGSTPPIGGGSVGSLSSPVTSATLSAPDTVLVTWTPVVGATSYEVTRSDNGSTIAVSNTTTLTQVLPLERSYVFSVQALGSAGARSALVQTQPIATGPPPPGSPTLSSTSAGATLGWVDLATTESGYRVLRRFGSEPLATLADLPAGTMAYSDATALPGRTYEYQLVTLSAISTSSIAANAGQTTPPFAGAPTISSVSSSVLLATGGELVTIQGTNFGHGMSVMLGSQAATNVVPNSASSLSFRTPAYAGSATTLLDIQATNSSGSGNLTNGVEYLADYVNEDFSGASFDARLQDPTGDLVLGGGAIRRSPAGPTPGVPPVCRLELSSSRLPLRSLSHDAQRRCDDLRRDRRRLTRRCYQQWAQELIRLARPVDWLDGNSLNYLDRTQRRDLSVGDWIDWDGYAPFSAPGRRQHTLT